MAKISVSDNGCWNWTANKNPYGYGLIWVDGKSRRAHRISYTLFIGKLPADQVVMHSCDNPGCVNPKHLSKGTRLENNRDAVKKKRNQHGESHWNARLTNEQVRSILTDRRRQKDIAASYGVNPATISKIKSRKIRPSA